MNLPLRHPPPRLAQFQNGFARALIHADNSATHDDVLAPLVAQPAFAVYRNTVLKGCIDALAANFPAVQRLVGEEWFRDAAAIYARQQLPQRPMLLDYGEDFPRFLAAFAPAAELPYLAGVAQLDRWWSEAHFAGDEAPLGADELAALPPESLSRLRLRPHVATRWAWFDVLPIGTIWQRNRRVDAAPAADPIDWHGEGVLIVRPRGAVETVFIGAAGCAFMDACAAGSLLPAAVQAAAQAEGSADLAELTATLFSSGAFARPQIPDVADLKDCP